MIIVLRYISGESYSMTGLATVRLSWRTKIFIWANLSLFKSDERNLTENNRVLKCPRIPCDRTGSRCDGVLKCLNHLHNSQRRTRYTTMPPNLNKADSSVMTIWWLAKYGELQEFNESVFKRGRYPRHRNVVGCFLGGFSFSELCYTFEVQHQSLIHKELKLFTYVFLYLL